MITVPASSISEFDHSAPGQVVASNGRSTPVVVSRVARRQQPIAEFIRVAKPATKNDSPLLPRSSRRPGRRREDRGLPDRSVVESLYRSYRNVVDRLWPELVGTELLPSNIETVLESVVDRYSEKHRNGGADTAAIESRLSVQGIRNAGMFYGRYSCDASQQTSIHDQLGLSVTFAKSEEAFIPFELVFADFSVSGLTDDRPGFDGVRKAIRTSASLVATVYVSESHRASRNISDWQKLLFLARKHRKVLKSADSELDSSRPGVDALIARGSATSAEEKERRVRLIRRGRIGAMRRGTSLGKPPLGYTRRQKIDELGRPRFKPSGTPLTEWTIEPESRRIVEQIFEWFTKDHWSLRKIAKTLNQRQTDNAGLWKSNTVKRVLENTTYLGVLFRNQHTEIQDPSTGKKELISRQRHEHVVVHMPDLAFVAPSTFKAARRRLAELKRNSPLTGRKWTKMERDPRTPFDGLLYCACCQKPITRTRSGKHAQYASVNGLDQIGGCELTTSKSVRLVEETLATQLVAKLLTPEIAETVTSLANQQLQTVANGETDNPDAIRRSIARRQGRINNLVESLAETKISSVRSRIAQQIDDEQSRELEEKKKLEQILQQRKLRHVDLTSHDVLQAFADVRRLLSEDVSRAANLLRELFGPILVHQEPCTTHDGLFRWVATCRPKWKLLLAKLAPEGVRASVLRILDGLGDTVRTVIEKSPGYQELAPRIAELYSRGQSKAAIARELKRSVMLVTDALNFHFSGMVPSRKKLAHHSTPRPLRTLVNYRKIADEVVRLRLLENWSFGRIAERFGCSRGRVERAYRFGCQKSSAESGATPPAIRRVRQLPKQQWEVIQALAVSDLTTAEIARQAGCSHQTVARYRKSLRAE